MSEPLKSIHIRVTPEDHRRLEIMSELEGKGIADVAESIIAKDLNGSFHAVTVAAAKFERLGLNGKKRD